MSGARKSNADIEPFPPIEQGSPIELAQSSSADRSKNIGKNRLAASSSLSGRLRRVSQSFEQSELPEGFFAATGGIASSILSRQAGPRPVSSSIGSAKAQPAVRGENALQPTPVHPVSEEGRAESKNDGSSAIQAEAECKGEPPSAAPFPNGYHFPPKHSFGESTRLGLLAFWNYFLTPVGFAVTIYGLNVVAWGGMLFLLLCNACKSTFNIGFHLACTNQALQHLPCATLLATTSIHHGASGSRSTRRSSTPYSVSPDSDLPPGGLEIYISCYNTD